MPDDACLDEMPAPDAEGWIDIDLAAHPELSTVGGQAAISVPESLLEIVVAQIDDGCFIAAWRICPHGACDVEWRDDERDLWCPCHGSRFDTQGTLLQGPADRDLRTFPVEVREGRLRVFRPL
jgi:Rieske Fe-S protein